MTEQQETAPFLRITHQKELFFETPENTIEGTAFKSLVVYDLSVLELLPIPALIHDSNILKRIEDTHLKHILDHYYYSKQQIFIGFDKVDSTTEKARKILKTLQFCTCQTKIKFSVVLGAKIYGMIKYWRN
ncbi:DUF2326 domain-containing protein [Psychrobacillus sp. L4]|uniref:DUF2326 domain-containing protein n=1 Tax=Psychrobacillus sp. L4 TaxID=3236892 RepID=UPI0036F43E17